jgi:hypothetical protein
MAIKTQKFNKTEFIRARPNMQPMDIVEEASKLGHLIKVNLIWNTRSKDRKATGAEATGKKASKKAKKVTTQVVQATEVAAESTFNKSDFIRKRPNKSAADISTEAEALGQDIPPQMVWSIRSADKKKVSEAAPPKRVAKKVVAKKAAKKVVAKSAPARKVAKKTAKRVAPVSMQPTKVPMTGSSAFAQTRNGNKVTLVVFDPRDPKAVKAATAAMREAVANA